MLFRSKGWTPKLASLAWYSIKLPAKWNPDSGRFWLVKGSSYGRFWVLEGSGKWKVPASGRAPATS